MSDTKAFDQKSGKEQTDAEKQEGGDTLQAQLLIPEEQQKDGKKKKFHNLRAMMKGPSTKGGAPLDKNSFTHKKTMAQGFMDMALMTANAAQLKLVLYEGKHGRIFLFEFVMFLLVCSIIVQILVGILLFIKSRYNIEEPKDHKYCEMANNWATGLVMIVTILNVFISAFVMVENSSDKPAAAAKMSMSTAACVCPSCETPTI
ncbi:ninjurin-1-like [Branchiostoma floridae x Branchiostoma belcheri]